MKLEHSLTPCIKLSIQLIKDVGLDILNLLDYLACPALLTANISIHFGKTDINSDIDFLVLTVKNNLHKVNVKAAFQYCFFH